MASSTNAASYPARGFFADGFEPVARQFVRHLERGEETGAGVSVYHRGEHVVNLWGGLADAKAGRSWESDTRIVLFSVTKGLMAMALNMLSDRGQLDWDAPVTTYWPAFGQRGKEGMTVRTLMNHRGGLPYLSYKLTLDQCLHAESAGVVRRAMETQEPAWTPGQTQAYHAQTFGLYARELFERITGESPGTFLSRELFEPLGSDVRLGAPASVDHAHAALYSPSVPTRLARLIGTTFIAPETAEARITKSMLAKDSAGRLAFSNPNAGGSVLVFNEPKVRRAELAWASATGSADGVARAYLPFAQGGTHDGRTYVASETLSPIYERQSWSEQDEVLQKALGWSQGFLKEQRHLFSPNPESFGHAGMGGALGWADPVANVSFGYVMNKMDWRVRSPRVLALCHALYECEPLK